MALPLTDPGVVPPVGPSPKVREPHARLERKDARGWFIVTALVIIMCVLGVYLVRNGTLDFNTKGRHPSDTRLAPLEPGVPTPHDTRPPTPR